MGATPNFDANDMGNSSLGNSAGSTGMTGNTAQNDDISFSRGGVGNSNARTSDSASNTRSAIDTGVDKAQDAISQIQQKASEITARIVDNVNVEDITQKLEAQVREHPARTLLLAVGAGFLLGRTMSSHKSNS